VPTWITGNLIAVLCMVIWATSFPLTDVLLRDWHPLLLVAARLVPGSLVIFLCAVLAGQGEAIRRADWRTILYYGGIGMGLGTTLVVWAQDYADAVTVSIILTTMPLISALMGHFAGKERVTFALLMGIAFAIAGGVLIILDPAAGTLKLRGGEVLALISVTLWAWFARGAATHMADLPDLARAACSMVAASLTAVTMAAASVAMGVIEVRYDLSLASVSMVLWVGIIANGISMITWMTASRLLGVTVTAIHLNGVPFYVILMALAVGGAIHGAQVWGACLVAAGALLAQLPARKRRPATLTLED